MRKRKSKRNERKARLERRGMWRKKRMGENRIGKA